MTHEFQVHDVVFYTGEMKDYLYKLWYIVGIAEPNDSQPDRIYLIAGKVDGAIVNWQTTRPDLLTFCYNAAPKWNVGDEVYMFVNDVDFRQGVVTAVHPSLTNAPNEYSVQFSEVLKVVSEKELWWIDLNKLDDSTVVTLNHIKRVRQILTEFAISLLARGERHDESKFHPREKLFLDAMQYLIDHEGSAPYGSDEYKRRTAILKPMLSHHYSENSHHAEHYRNGLYGMTLMDIVEMFADWRAAADRGEESAVNLTYAAERYNMSDQLKQIFINTYDKFGMKWK